MVPIVARMPTPVAWSLPAPWRPRASFLAGVHRLAELSLVRFLLVGSVGLATDAATFSAASAAGMPDWIARALSLGIATLVTWRLNRRFTFAGSGRAPAEEAARYAGVALGAQGFNYGLFLVLRTVAPELPPLGALLVGAVAAAGFSFAGQSLLTFRAKGGALLAALTPGRRR